MEIVVDIWQNLEKKPNTDYDFLRPLYLDGKEKSTFYRNSFDLPTLLKSNLGCFQRVPLTGTIVLKTFFVTKQRTQKF